MCLVVSVQVCTCIDDEFSFVVVVWCTRQVLCCAAVWFRSYGYILLLLLDCNNCRFHGVCLGFSNGKVDGCTIGTNV